MRYYIFLSVYWRVILMGNKNQKPKVNMRYDSEGNKFTGQFRGELLHGQGKIEHITGHVYNGYFEYGRLLIGWYIDPQGNKYEGSFKDFKPHGSGKIQYANGDRFIGYFIAGHKYEKGLIIPAEGEIQKMYVLFYDDKKQGEAVVKLNNGTWERHIYNNDKLVLCQKTEPPVKNQKHSILNKRSKKIFL